MTIRHWHIHSSSIQGKVWIWNDLHITTPWRQDLKVNGTSHTQILQRRQKWEKTNTRGQRIQCFIWEWRMRGQMLWAQEDLPNSSTAKCLSPTTRQDIFQTLIDPLGRGWGNEQRVRGDRENPGQEKGVHRRMWGGWLFPLSSPIWIEFTSTREMHVTRLYPLNH